MGTVDRQITETDDFQAVVTTDTNIYASGDALSTQLLSFADQEGRKCNSGRITKAVVMDKDNQRANMDLILFAESASNSVFWANAPFGINDADGSKIAGVLHITDHTNCGSLGVSQWEGDMPFRLRSGNTLYALPVSRGTPTYSSVASLIIRLGILQD